MLLSWKDGITTLLAVLLAGFTYLMYSGLTLPFNWSYRAGTVFLLILGIGMCALSSPTTGGGAKSPLVMLAGVMGIMSFGLIIFSLITGTKTAFIVTASVILLLWMVATIRHLLGL